MVPRHFSSLAATEAVDFPDSQEKYGLPPVGRATKHGRRCARSGSQFKDNGYSWENDRGLDLPTRRPTGVASETTRIGIGNRQSCALDNGTVARCEESGFDIPACDILTGGTWHDRSVLFVPFG